MIHYLSLFPFVCFALVELYNNWETCRLEGHDSQLYLPYHWFLMMCHHIISPWSSSFMVIRTFHSLYKESLAFTSLHSQ